MITTAKILQFDGTQLLLAPDEKLNREIIQKHIGSVELRLNDGRTISADQRKKSLHLSETFLFGVDTTPSTYGNI